MLVAINLAGGSYQHKSERLSNQRTRNFWPQIQSNQKERSNYILQPTYGLSVFAQPGGGADRGMFENQDTLYKISGTVLNSVASDGTHTALATIPGAGRCIMDALGADITITTDGNAYVWDGAVLTTVTDQGISPNTCTAINNQMVYEDGNAGSEQAWWVSDVGDATSIFGLNNANAESTPSALKRPYAFKETLNLFKADAIELWWNSGQGNPPFDKIQGGVINIGLDAIYSVAKTSDYVFFLGKDRQVHSLTGGSSAVDSIVSTPAMAKQFQDYASTSDAVGFCMQLEGQWFYVLTFPTQNITWAYPIGGEWFEWGTGINGRIRASSYAFAHGKHLVGDYQSANIYELDPETYTDNGETIVRTRISAPIHGGLFKLDGKALEMNRLELFLETGATTLLQGQGSDPEVMMSYSDDGGATWSTQRRGKIGKMGQKMKKVEWFNCGRFYERLLRIDISDPVYTAILGAAAEIEPCI